MKIILLIGIAIILLISGCNNLPEIKLEELGVLGVNLDIINNPKYEIFIDCEWVNEHLNDTTIWFPKETIELCKYAFPELYENSVEEE